MTHLQHNVLIESHFMRVYAALTESSELQNWWQHEVRRGRQRGDPVALHIAGVTFTGQVERVSEGKEVAWTCETVEGPGHEAWEAWRDTQITFWIYPHGEACTRLDLEHFGMTPESPGYTQARSMWADLLSDLQRYLEQGS